MHAVHGGLTTGRKIGELTVLDTYSRFSPAAGPRFSYRDVNVVVVWSRSVRRWAARRRSGWRRAV